MIPQYSSGNSNSNSDSPTSSKPRLLPAEKINVCLVCGDKGDLKRLVYCIQCKSCAEHSYCQEKFNKDGDGPIIWRCEDCAPINPKCEPEQLRKSVRLSHATEAKYNRMIMKIKSDRLRNKKSVKSSEGESPKCHTKIDIEKRRPILENKNVHCEEKLQLPKAPLNISPDKQAQVCENYVDSKAANHQCSCCPEFDKNSRAQPLPDPVWTGQFRLNNTTHFQLVAYASSKACSKANLAITGLPRLLNVEMLLRRVIWPKSFDAFQPNGDSIALYFFPQYERDEVIFDDVLNDVIEQDRALIAVINNVELLIFSSHLLPPDDRRICKKYYLWGVFKQKPIK